MRTPSEVRRQVRAAVMQWVRASLAQDMPEVPVYQGRQDLPEQTYDYVSVYFGEGDIDRDVSHANYTARAAVSIHSNADTNVVDDRLDDIAQKIERTLFDDSAVQTAFVNIGAWDVFQASFDYQNGDGNAFSALRLSYEIQLSERLEVTNNG